MTSPQRIIAKEDLKSETFGPKIVDERGPDESYDGCQRRMTNSLKEKKASENCNDVKLK